VSCYEWSHGTIVLPSNQFAMVKTVVADAVTADYEKQYAQAQHIWTQATAKQKRSVDAYREYINGLTLHYALAWKLIPYNSDKPRRLKRTDWAFPTNRTVSFHEEDLSIGFDPKARTVTYSVGENNHAREHAAATVLHAGFYQAIGAVKWSNQSGGVILGNDEYNREAGYENEGGGGSYVVDAFGPMGAREAPGHVDKFMNAEGRWMMPEVTYTARSGQKVKIVPYAPKSSPYRSRLYG
jgi:hypothetical protein